MSSRDKERERKKKIKMGRRMKDSLRKESRAEKGEKEEKLT